MSSDSPPRSPPQSILKSAQRKKKVQTINYGKGNPLETKEVRRSINSKIEREDDGSPYSSDDDGSHLSQSMPSSSYFDVREIKITPPTSPNNNASPSGDKKNRKEVDLPGYDSSPNLGTAATDSRFHNKHLDLNDPKLVHRSASDSDAQPRPTHNNASNPRTWKAEDTKHKGNFDLDFYRQWKPKSWKKDEKKEQEKEQRRREKEQRKREKEANGRLFHFGRRRKKWEDEPQMELIPEKRFRTLVCNIPKRKVVLPISSEDLVGQFDGPNQSGAEIESEIESVASAVCTSTYPNCEDGSKYGDPVCDRYAIKVFKKTTILILADGCGWGPRAKEAAVRATAKMSQFLERNCKKVKSTKHATDLLLQGIEKAHDSIFEGKAPEDTPGTTAIMAGLILQLDHPEIIDGVSYDSVFVCVNVGDCKALHFKGKEQMVEDLTAGNRQNILGATDPGGRLGPNPDGEPIPDLRNLQTYYTFCSNGDMIALVSDGVHDNFDPQMLGHPPESLSINAESWDKVKVEDFPEVGKLKSKMWNKIFNENVIQTMKQNNQQILPSELSHEVIKYCVNLTKKSRDWMQSHPGQLPSDYVSFPGKLDHTTIISTKIGWS